MARSTARLTFSMIALGVLLFAVTVHGFAQDLSTPTAADQPQSVFKGDICAPPCWFGLVAGESTAADVEHMLAEFDDVFFRGLGEPDDNQVDPATGYIVEGTYYVYWKKPRYEYPESISISNSIVDAFGVKQNQDLRLRDMLRLLGQPDIVYFDNPQITEFGLTLVYSDMRILIYMSERPGTERCSIGSIRIHFQFDYEVYLSSYLFETRVEEFPSYLPYLREIPSDVWQDWLDGKVGDYCSDAWEQLPQPEVTPEPVATQQP